MFIGNPIGEAMNNTEWAFPLAECFHIAAFAFAIGTIAVVDLKLLGLGIKKQSAAQLLQDTEMWTLVGLAVVLIAGVPIFISQPEIYWVNSAFWFKMYCILAAIIFHYAVLRPVVTGRTVARWWVSWWRSSRCCCGPGPSSAACLSHSFRGSPWISQFTSKHWIPYGFP